MMRSLLLAVFALAVAAGCDCRKCDENIVRSPDGRNEVRLYAKPLAFEVYRDGVKVVGKTSIGLKANGRCLVRDGEWKRVECACVKGTEQTPVYKKERISLDMGGRLYDFGEVALRVIARDDGVAYRFETKLAGETVFNCEKAPVVIPDPETKCWVYYGRREGCEEEIPVAEKASELKTGVNGHKVVYAPLVYTVGGKYVAVTESDVHDYPTIYFTATNAVTDGSVRLDSTFAKFPKKTHRVGGWGKETPATGGRWVVVDENEDYLVKGNGTRKLPWRVFVLGDSANDFCRADIVNALATPSDGDYSWVKPGKVAWDWWNCFDNAPKTSVNGGCTTKTYERFIDFAAKTGVEYVIFDEGWSETLNIWKFHPEVDVPHLIDYANRKGVGIILWMAWAQVYGEEEKVAAHFAKLGAKGFKVDFMDRGDADVNNFLEKFAAACAKERMLIDYHGATRPVGLSRTYPNVVNYEGIHGLEQMKWFRRGEDEMMLNDIRAFYMRLTAGPMDYTPGAMINWAIGKGYRGEGETSLPGSVGTRSRQMAMMALYEAPLQMLCDSPTNYEKNEECFAFMAKVPVVWKDVVGLGGDPDSFVAAARQAKDGSWYAAAISSVEPRDITISTAFLGAGEWQAEIFRDAPDCDQIGGHYVHERKSVKVGEPMTFHTSPGGGFIVKFTK